MLTEHPFPHEFSWTSEVRAHELDAQGIVNNAHYFCYFDHVRTLQMRALGFDWVQLSQKGFNLVLASAAIDFLKSLTAFDSFTIVSRLEPEGRIKLIFNQTIFNNQQELVCRGMNTVVCVDKARGKPISIDRLLCELRHFKCPTLLEVE
ncbi:hypothetical protein B1207_14415 [Legionella quinlivanii]|uniref:Acyl-CoA thioesterase n=1 Tax=Legionella quinlivanii TaxID=45073 RepID=A0A364LG80_9GAMM|nr:thioesterase family protein [Legionella quinlivanii]RAP34884.1 hypothetical protein B1207_14415 [Legionella quinlivanii]